MERARATRYIRITVTALSLTACVLLIALWVRSYYYRDFALIDVSTSRWIHLISMHGRLSCAVANAPGTFSAGSAPILVPGIDYYLLRQRFTEVDGSQKIPRKFRLPISNSVFFDWNMYDDGVEIIIPYWIFVFVLAALAATPWIRWSRRFRLRTLLIATTLIAVGLGIVAVLS